MTATSPYTRLWEAPFGLSAYILERPPIMNRQPMSIIWERIAVGLRPHLAARCVPKREQARHHTLRTTFYSVSWYGIIKMGETYGF